MLKHVLHLFGAVPHGGEWQTLISLVRYLRNRGVDSTVIDLADVLPPSKVKSSGASYITREAGETGEQCVIRVLNKRAISLMQSWGDYGNLVATRVIDSTCTAVPLILRLSSARTMQQAALPEAPASPDLLAETARRSPGAFACIYTSEQVRGVHERIRFNPQRSHVIYNGVCTNTYSPFRDLPVHRQAAIDGERQRLGLKQHGWVIGHAGRYSPFVKNQLGFLDAAKQLLKTRKDVHFIMAGDGIHADNREIRDKIAECQLGPHITLLGPREDMETVYHLADLWSSVSRTEAFSNTILEAMACGAIVTSTNVGMPELTIANPSLILDPPHEYPTEPGWSMRQADLWHSTISLPEEIRREIASNNRATILQHFDRKGCFEAYWHAYQQALA